MALFRSTQTLLFKSISTVVASTLFMASAGTSIGDAAKEVVDMAQKIQNIRAKVFSDKPTKVFLGRSPSRDETRTAWWTQRMRDTYQLEKAKRKFERISQGIEELDLDYVFASTALPSLYFQGGPGNDGGGSAPGEGGSGSGGSGSAGSGAGGGSPTGTGGPSGQTNTNTGNNLLTYPITAFSSRGHSGVSLTLYHSSLSDYNRAWGHKWSSSYDAEITYTPGQQAVLRMPDGLTLPYQEIVNGSFQRPAGIYSNLVRNTNGSFTLTNKDQTKLEFNSAGYLTAVKDRIENATTINRNSSNYITAVTSADGRQLTFSYNSQNRISSITNHLGQTWNFGYSAGGNLTTQQFPVLNGSTPTRSFTYDSSNRILTENDLRGGTWSWSYASDGKLASSTTAMGRTTTFTYTSSATVITRPNGSIETHNYSNGLLASVVDAAGFSTSRTYDSNRNVVTFADKRGKVTTLTYDANGNVLTVTNPLGQVTTTAYNASNDPTTVSRGGVTTMITYLASGLRHKVIDPLSRDSSTTSYNSFGEVTSVADAMGRTTSYTYDSLGNISSITKPGGLVTTIAVNETARTRTIVAPGSGTVVVTADAWGRTASINRVGLGSSTFAYNEHGQRVSSTDPLNRTTSWLIDLDGNVNQHTNPRGDVEAYSFNNMDWMTSKTNGRGKVSTYTRNTRGQISQSTLPDGSTEQYTYDANGRVVTYTSPLLYQINYEYDDAGNLTKIDYPSGTDTTFAYDSLGRRTSMVDSTGTTQWTYDAASQLTQLVQPQGSQTYTYNAAGQRTSMTEVGLGTTNYAFDASGRLTALTNRHNETTSFSYNVNGQLSAKASANGVTDFYTLDSYGRQTGVETRNASNTVLRSESYTFDAADQMSTRVVDGLTTIFAYDAASQLVMEARTGYTGLYSYDANGNRLTKSLNGGTPEVYTYDDGDKLLSAGSKTYSYDAAGRTTSVTQGGQTTLMSYDFESRLTSVTGPGISATYSYNGLDTRISKVENSVSQTFVRDGAYVTDPVLRDSTASYTPGLSSRVGSDSTFMHSGLNNSELQTSSTSAIQGVRTYDAFGNLVASSGTWSGPFGYAGSVGYQEDSTGLKLLGHRYYDPSTGRFLTRDPAKDGRNWYVYCDSNPITYHDDLGLGKIKGILKIGKHIWNVIEGGLNDAIDHVKGQGGTPEVHSGHPKPKDDLYGPPELRGPPHVHMHGKGHKKAKEHYVGEDDLDDAVDRGVDRFKDWRDWILGMILPNPVADIKDGVDIFGEAITPAVEGAHDGLNFLGRKRWLDDEDAALL
jgi:RHS repeat-associated protein